ncbi:XAC2610-related protein [Achromobacter aloeverae]
MRIPPSFRRSFRPVLDRFRLAVASFALMLLAAAFAMPAAQAQAADAANAANASDTANAADGSAAATVEFPAWSILYFGKIANRNVRVYLQRIAGQMSGNYCYVPCNASQISKLRLDGTWRDGGAALQEYDQTAPGKDKPVTGRWEMRPDSEGWTGTWTSPDGKRSYPLSLGPAPGTHPFPYEIRLVADGMPDPAESCVTMVPHVSQVRLYKDGRLVQSLPADSVGTCRIFVPDVADMDFDGWPDLTLAQFLPAGPNIPVNAWRYEPATGKFTDVTDELEDMTSPNFDAAHKQVWDFQRDGCCDHLVTVAKWQDGKLVQVDQGESFFLPVRIQGKIRYCYVMPVYHDGRVEYPDATWNAGERLLVRDTSDCDASLPPTLDRIRLEVYLRDMKTGQLSHEYSEKATLETVDVGGKPMQCPYITLLDDGKVKAEHVKGPEACTAAQ